MYFSTVNWYDFYTGKQYKPGTYRLQNVKITDRIPLFIAENSTILFQDSELVRSTRNLTNKYSLISGLKLDQKNSNSTNKYYTAEGRHSSLEDFYENVPKVDLCWKQSCAYKFFLNLTITQSVKQL